VNSQPGGYFITLCNYNHGCLFGKIVGEEIQLNKLGLIVKEEWLQTQVIHPKIELDEFIVMPNHLHGLLKK
jgi:REP element-mobilizing transposase RayT